MCVCVYVFAFVCFQIFSRAVDKFIWVVIKSFSKKHVWLHFHWCAFTRMFAHMPHKHTHDTHTCAMVHQTDRDRDRQTDRRQAGR